jgi:hypothetical protein
LDETLEQSLRFGSALRWIIGQTEDAREGPRAFAERRARTTRGVKRVRRHGGTR